ncbi:MAG: polysaccharide biosynthesis protein, partial [Desulfovibrio sp.]|nr:polysaccharide biosynthesis protein [Desulfovibrio sp.]
WKSDKAEFPRLAGDCVRWLIGVSLPIMFVLYVESDRIIGTIYGGAYHEAMWMQKYLVFTVICAFVHNLAAYLMMSQGKERLLLFIYVAGLALNLALCAVLIPADPLLGACLAMVVTKAAVAAATTIYCHVKMRIVGLRALLPIGLALTAGTALYLVSGLFGVREISEVLALVPFVFLVKKWRDEISARRKETA